MASICFSLMASGIEHLIVNLLVICVSSLEKEGPLFIFRSALFFFLAVEVYGFLIYWDINPLPDIYSIICKYSFSFPRLLFHTVDCFFPCAKALQFELISFFYFCFCCLYFWPHILKKSLVRLISRTFPPVFPYSSFTVSCPIFKWLIHLELAFVCDVR